MTKAANGEINAAYGDKGLPWEKPELRRMDAGSARAVDNKGGDDGGSGSTDKS